MPFQFIVTDAGRAALVNAQHNGTNAVTIAQVGFSGTPIVATPATTNLPGEVKRIATISGSAVAADTMHVIVRDESADVFTVRSVAFYLSDGTLFGAYGQPAVIGEKSAQAIFLLAVDVIFADIAAAMIQFGNANFLNPPATTDTAGVVKLATDADALALASAIKALTPRGMALAFSAANVLARLLTVDGAGSGLDADLLDGQEGSYYTNITARLGYTPLNAAYYTGAEILGRLVAVDGAGSGLDADLLDGRQGAEFALLSGASFVGSVAAKANITVGGPGLDGRISFGRALDGAVVGAIYWGSAPITGPLTIDNLNGGPIALAVQGAIVATVSAAGLSRGGYTVWDAANDGAGSGLDADLLDGRQASEFALLSGANFTGSVAALNVVGYQPGGGRVVLLPGDATRVGWISFQTVAGGETSYIGNHGFNSATIYGNAVGHYFTGPINRGGNSVWDAGNDGAGSGLDADLLDGQHGSYYADIVGRLGFTPANRNGDTFLGTVQTTASEGLRVRAASPFISFFDAANTTRQGYIQHTGSTLALVNEVGSTIAITASWFQRSGNTIWDAGNDGAGSGLDADMLDGRHASDFALLTDSTRAGSNAFGYWEKRPNGVIEQWGMITGPFPEGAVGIHYPIPFTDANSVNLTVTPCNFDGNNRKDMVAQFSSTTTTDGLAYLQWTAAASSLSQADGLMWRSVGR